MSEWTPPGASSSDFPSQPTSGIDALLRRVDSIKRELDDATNNLLKSAGMSVEPGRLTVNSELLVTGATRIEGTLSLPAGIIDNEALASPVTFAGNTGSLLTTPPPATWTIAASAPLTVPAWAGSGVVLATGWVQGQTGGAASALYGYITIAGDGGEISLANLAPGEAQSQPVIHQRTFDPTGTTVTVNLYWQASSPMIGGAAYISAIGMFGR
jgi:hypothetical protein